MDETNIYLNHTRSHWEVVQDHIRAANEGRPIGFANDPHEMWNMAVKYFIWCDRNPIYKPEMIRSGKRTGAVVNCPIQRPYTISGLCIHLGITKEYLYDAAKSKEQNDFYFVANKIIDVMYAQKLEFAYVGVFNPIISARELGLHQAGGKDEGSPLIQITVEGNSPPLLQNEADINITKEQNAKEQ